MQKLLFNAIAGWSALCAAAAGRLTGHHRPSRLRALLLFALLAVARTIGLPT